MLKLYGYWRSSADYRLRIALNIKKVEYERVIINIAPTVNAQTEAGFKALNPQMRVPVLETNKGALTQSMAILEWLEETYPQNPILPAEPFLRAQCRAFADTIACDVHPLNNLSVLKALRNDLDADEEQVKNWYADWILRGFAALEVSAKARQSTFLYGETPGLAEICLIPQIYNARRYGVDLSDFPSLVEIDEACYTRKAFELAHPKAQPDAI